MAQIAHLENDIRLYVYDHLLSEGRAQTTLEAAGTLGISQRRVLMASQRLVWEWVHNRPEPSWRKTVDEAQRLFTKLGRHHPSGN